MLVGTSMCTRWFEFSGGVCLHCLSSDSGETLCWWVRQPSFSSQGLVLRHGRETGGGGGAEPVAQVQAGGGQCDVGFEQDTDISVEGARLSGHNNGTHT